MGENLGVWVILQWLLPPQTGAVAVAFPAHCCSAGLGFPPSLAQFTHCTLYFSGKRNRNKSPDHLVAVAMRGSLGTAHGELLQVLLDGIPCSWAAASPASRCSGCHPHGLAFGATSGGFGPYRKSLWEHSSSALSSLIWWLWSWDVLPRSCLGCRLCSGMEVHPLSRSALRL